MTIFDTIVAQKRQEVARRRAITPSRQLQNWPLFKRQPLSMSQSLTVTTSWGIIAECKQKTTASGFVSDQMSIRETAVGYVRAGAACLSVLTDGPFFGGYTDDLIQARLGNPSTPILRKDFIVDPYQILEAKAIGTDCILLMAACLQPDDVFEYSQLAHALGMEVMLEVGSAAEVESYLHKHIDLVGVSQCAGNGCVTSAEIATQLATYIPDQFVKVVQRGKQSAGSILALKQAGYQGFLLGESLLCSVLKKGVGKPAIPGMSSAGRFTPNQQARFQPSLFPVYF
ncbi:indole-3-glycerol-phosphate synthase [Spirosoma aureum]|uniref:indole-3-glycerol-phosphate synthase n=1 Tax=Spirosoma aureum TaxID=2692134 RepID=A0A6G9ARA0_9BACT|nr:indole-3-glycerol phosphate synthase TrpC [Spirosoma aureum]QIP14866.1 indole-3-glycerol-phosphate synthase [Spirosoma aureum]